MKFRKKVRTFFDQGDPANIVFHGQHSIIVQRVLEAYIPELGISWDDWFKNKKIFMPVVQLNNEYKKPLHPGRDYFVEVQVHHVGTSSVGCYYRILDLKEEVCCVVTAIYVCVEKSTFKSCNLPDAWRAILEKIKIPSQ